MPSCLALALRSNIQNHLLVVGYTGRVPVFPDRRPFRAQLTLAQQSNLWPITAKLYDAWRVRSLSLLTGEAFGLAREFDLLLEWLKPQPGQQWLDVGTSTGNYARVLADAGTKVTAIDLSSSMLEQAVLHTDRATAAQQLIYDQIIFELANAEALPYADHSFAGVVLGATLNEFADTSLGLRECARVLAPGGQMFLMYLCQAPTASGRWGQRLFALAGIRFPAREQVRQTLAAAGMQLERAELRREPPPLPRLNVAPGKRPTGPLY
jgi:2-polyprenyl-3-methyl-5-hydroxy-6-metoxy-1,4-benzoquinol methylase